MTETSYDRSVGPSMYDFFIFLGWGVTAALIIVLWRRRRPGRSVVPGVLLGLMAGLLWPITLWVVLGLWWYWLGWSTPVSSQNFAPQGAQAQGQFAVATTAAPNPLRRTPIAGIVTVCLLGSLITIGVLGASAEEPQSAASSVDTMPPSATTSTPPTTLALMPAAPNTVSTTTDLPSVSPAPVVTTPFTTTVPKPTPILPPRPTPQPPPTSKAPPATQAAPASECDPNYEGACVPIASDVDCEGGSGNGPEYVRGPVYVVGQDVYGLDRDGDGVGCQS